jgi:hypothetical protein
LAQVQAPRAVVLAAAVAVQVPVRAGRADQEFCRFESDNAGPGARVIVLTNAFCYILQRGGLPNNRVSRASVPRIYDPSGSLSFFRSLASSSARIRADRMGRDRAVRLIHRTGVHRAEPWFEPSISIAFMRQFFPPFLGMIRLNPTLFSANRSPWRGRQKKASPVADIVWTKRARSKYRFRLSQLVSAINKQL